jgi:hypothetical protein
MMHLREVWNQPYAPLENATGLFRYGKRELKRGFWHSGYGAELVAFQF